MADTIKTLDADYPYDKRHITSKVTVAKAQAKSRGAKAQREQVAKEIAEQELKKQELAIQLKALKKEESDNSSESEYEVDASTSSSEDEVVIRSRKRTNKGTKVPLKPPPATRPVPDVSVNDELRLLKEQLANLANKKKEPRKAKKVTVVKLEQAAAPTPIQAKHDDKLAHITRKLISF